MRTALRLLLIAGLLTQTVLAQETFDVDPAHSNVEFKIRHLVSEVRGRFNDFGGQIVYNAKDPAKSTVNLTVQAKSIDTNSPKRDEHLRSKDFFDVATYPTLSFVSTSVQTLDDKKLKVTGNFTLHGVTRPLTAQVRLFGPSDTPMGRRMGAATEFTIDRREFKVNSWNDPNAVVGDEVKIEITVEARAR